jgi:hypothetical protein
MSCGHDGCTCGPDHTDHHQHDPAHGHDLPVQNQNDTDEGGCCGGGHHHDDATDRDEGVVAHSCH